MLLYLEEQLDQAYRVYLSKVPMGHKAADKEAFREMVESDESLFEDLLAEYSTQQTLH
tara:strand:+ start:546 stop:719 length:174 start_codon:yes stop_codon:yes gene_type:complete